MQHGKTGWNLVQQVAGHRRPPRCRRMLHVVDCTLPVIRGTPSGLLHAALHVTRGTAAPTSAASIGRHRPVRRPATVIRATVDALVCAHACVRARVHHSAALLHRILPSPPNPRILLHCAARPRPALRVPFFPRRTRAARQQRHGTWPAQLHGTPVPNPVRRSCPWRGTSQHVAAAAAALHEFPPSVNFGWWRMFQAQCSPPDQQKKFSIYIKNQNSLLDQK